MGRNGGHDRYRAALADENAWTRARRSKCCKLANSPRLRRAVAGEVRMGLSPEQRTGLVKRKHSKKERNKVLHKTIDPSIFIQKTGGIKKKTLNHILLKSPMR